MSGVWHTDFDEVVIADFEFGSQAGDCPEPRCLVAHSLRAGRTDRVWFDGRDALGRPPYDVGSRTLFVAYYASAELGCHHALGWQRPENVLDLYVEFRALTNGVRLPSGAGLLGALGYFGLSGIGATEKNDLRLLALRGGEYTAAERQALLGYCESDVRALEMLWEKMRPLIDIERALLRGRYAKAVAHMESVGVPVDVESFNLLRGKWDQMEAQLIERIDRDFGVFEGRTFKAERWGRWLAERNIPWPRLESGALALDDDSFRETARAYPEVAAMHELRATLGKMRLSKLAVGLDGRNRCMLSSFAARTGRNQPSTSKFVFGPACWIRGLIKPPEGWALAYIDWSQQEFAIAAALSGDEAMARAYDSGDPYLAFAKQAGAIPPDGTKKTHAAERELYKACILATQYGMGGDSLAMRIGKAPAFARDLLQRHREAFPAFWKWSDAAVDVGMLHGKLNTVFGWTIHVGADANPRSLRNFPMQANGAEMLRLACCFATERGIRVCAPIHDALLIEAPIDEIDEAVAETQRAMSDASALVLDGFRLRSDVKIVRWPDRYMDERGAKMWAAVWDVIHELEQ